MDVLPSALRNAVVALAHFIQVDESLPAQDGLGIFSSTIARKVVVLEGDWWEETNLWELGCAASGERKSATLRKLMEPVREVERERRESEQQQIADETASAELLQQQYQQAVKRAGGQESEPDRIAAEIEARELARRIGEQEAGRTSPTRLVVDDVTPEYLGRELAANNPLLFASAEGGLLDNFINRYSNIPNLDLLNGSFSGDDYSPGRATRNAESVSRPISCFALSPQPIIVSGLTTNPILVARGTVSRFLYWFVPGRAGTRAVETQTLDHAAVAAWDQRIKEMLSLPDPGESPYQVRMSAEAIAVMLPYRQRVEGALASIPVEDSGMRAWLNRARGQAQRLAANLHLLAHGVDGVASEIAAEHAVAAVELMTAYEEHARIAFDLMDDSVLVRRARTLLGWLRARNAAGTVVEVRDVQRSHTKWGSAADTREVLTELQGRGWVWMESRDATRFHVHPELGRW